MKRKNLKKVHFSNIVNVYEYEDLDKENKNRYWEWEALHRQFWEMKLKTYHDIIDDVIKNKLNCFK